ncbi:TonB family protein [Novosphingobium sp.]|uniref:TonB family protein n=1 Tax=Novosphingobium sp. TaxID=1874826 RepID=UPI0031D4C42D
MTYVSSHANPRQRMAVLASVGLIHAIGIYALVNGLGGVIVTMITRANPQARNIEVQMPLPQTIPTPKPAPETPLTVPDTKISLIPLPRPTFDPLPTPLPSTLPTTIGNGIGDTNLVPLPPAPPVHRLDPVAAKPLGQPGTWASAEDYPSLDLNSGHEGTTRFSLTIGADGRVSSCTVTSSSGWPGLDNATCKLITRRAKFSPALDESGQPTAGGFASAVRWVVPR